MLCNLVNICPKPNIYCMYTAKGAVLEPAAIILGPNLSVDIPDIQQGGRRDHYQTLQTSTNIARQRKVVKSALGKSKQKASWRKTFSVERAPSMEACSL